MIKELHGKHYYLEIEKPKHIEKVLEFIEMESAFKGEKFVMPLTWHKPYVIRSEAWCEEWRGDKYSAWERVKRKYYTLKKSETL